MPTDQPPRKPRGIVCPRCGGRMKRVRDSREQVNGTVYRRRECSSPDCGQRCTTEERLRRQPA